MILYFILGIAIAYLLLLFVLFRLIVPYLGWTAPDTVKIPKSMLRKIEEIKRKNPTKMDH